MAAGLSQAYPLQGGDGSVKATLFGAVRAPLQDQNATEEILKLDIGLIGAQNATYELVDDKNYGFSPLLYKNLQPGRQLLYFIAPKDDLFKLIKVTPIGGTPFNINWWATPKGINEDLIIRYYGITDLIWDQEQQAMVFELRIGNNGTDPLYLGPENITMLDQWGWIYYPVVGFEPAVIEPKEATGRVKVGFSGISLQSRPAKIAYDYGLPNQIIIDLENDAGPLSDDLVYGNRTASAKASPAASVVPAGDTEASSETDNETSPSQSTQSQSTTNQPSSPASAATVQSPAGSDQLNQTPQNMTTEKKILSLKDQINASKSRLKGVGEEDASEGESTIGKKINSSVEGTKERLAKARERLKSNNQSA